MKTLNERRMNARSEKGYLCLNTLLKDKVKRSEINHIERKIGDAHFIILILC